MYNWKRALRRADVAKNLQTTPQTRPKGKG